MKITFLGTGNAWGMNELSPDLISQAILHSKDPRDRRMRSSLYVETGDAKVLVDCGPDFSHQRRKYRIERIDALLITHSHRDHTGGLDDLTPYRRARIAWEPIPAYAHPDAWKEIKGREGFGHFMSRDQKKKVLEEKEIAYGKSFSIGDLTVTPFETVHGAYPVGPAGYILDAGGKRAVYTSDFGGVKTGGEAVTEKRIDVLIMETNWFNEPETNTCGHMSFQKALDYLERWAPAEVYLLHFGDEDMIPGDPWNGLPGKMKPRDPLPCAVPKTHAEWDAGVRAIFSENLHLKRYGSQKDIISYDGLVLDI